MPYRENAYVEKKEASFREQLRTAAFSTRKTEEAKAAEVAREHLVFMKGELSKAAREGQLSVVLDTLADLLPPSVKKEDYWPAYLHQAIFDLLSREDLSIKATKSGKVQIRW